MALRISAYKGTDPTSDKQLLVDALVLPIFTYGPVDRVAESRGGWGESTQQEAGVSSSTPADEDSARELEREMTGFRSADRQRRAAVMLLRRLLEGVQKPSL